MEKNNQELYALLKMYNSDSISDNSEVVLAPQKKKKLTKHRRRKPGSGSAQMTPQICGGRTVSLTLALSLLLCWLLTLTWLAVVLNSQIQHLDLTVQSVVAGSQGVPEALQKCHTLSKQLQQNQTALFLKLNLLSTQLNNFTTQVTVISNRLNGVEQRFKTSPELIKVPHDLETLTTNIATFGSQMQDLVTTMGQLKESNARLAETTKGVQTNVTGLQNNISALSVPPVVSPAPSIDVQGLQATINTVKANLSIVNDTLSKKIQWALDDLVSEKKQIEGLQERSENVSTRVTSLQNECSAKGAQITSLATSVDQVTSQVAKQDDHWTQMTNRLSELSAVCSQLQNNNTQLSEQLVSLKKTLSSDNQTTVTNNLGVQSLTSVPPISSLTES